MPATDLLHSAKVFFSWEGRATTPQWVRTSSFTRFLDHTQQHTIDGRSPLDEWSARSRDLYLTKHNIHNRQTSMPPVLFEPIISAIELPQTHALDWLGPAHGLLKKKTKWPELHMIIHFVPHSKHTTSGYNAYLF